MINYRTTLSLILKALINGTLQLDGEPIPNALVAIQINDRHQPLSFRTATWDRSSRATNNAPLAASVIAVVGVPPGLSNSSYNWQVPTDAELGTRAIYGNACTDLPQCNGASYSPEKSSQFYIISAAGAFEHFVQTAYPSQLPSDYYSTASTFKTVHTRLGNYTVHAVAEYWGIIDHESTTFEVTLLGDVNGDNYVNAKDATTIGKNFGNSGY